MTKRFFTFATIATLLCSCESEPGIAPLDNEDVATMNFSISNIDAFTEGDEIGIYVFDQSSAIIEPKQNLRYVVAANGVLTPFGEVDKFERREGTARNYHAYYPYDETLSAPIISINTADQTESELYSKRSCRVANNKSYNVAFDMAYIPNVYSVKFTTESVGIDNFDATKIVSVVYSGSHTESNYSLSNFSDDVSSFTHVDDSVSDIAMEDDGDDDPLTYRVAVLPDFALPSQHLIRVVYSDESSTYTKDLSFDGIEPTDDYIEIALNFSDVTPSVVPTAISIDTPARSTLDVIETEALTAQLTTPSGVDIDESEYIIKWCSDNPLVVAIDNDGNITALREGSANITASVEELGLTSTPIEIAVNALESFSCTEFQAGGKYETITPSSNEWVISDTDITGLTNGWNEIQAAIAKYGELYKGEQLSITFSNMIRNLRTKALTFDNYTFTEESPNPLVALSLPEYTNPIAKGSFANMPNLKSIYAPKVTKVPSEFIGCIALETIEVATAEGYKFTQIADPSFATATGETTCNYKLIIGETVDSKITIDLENNTLSDGTTTYTFKEIETK